MEAKEFFIKQAKDGKYTEVEIEGQKVAIREASYTELQALANGADGEEKTVAGILKNVCCPVSHTPLFTFKELETNQISNVLFQKFMKAFFDANTIVGDIEKTVKN